jgi:hypothetical protein
VRRSTRAERAAEARRLRDQGLLLREIGERMGVSTQAVHEWLSDPDGSLRRARKASYRGVCVDCGGPTDGSNGPGKASVRCMDCIAWTREGILLAIMEWADDHGGVPPREQDVRIGAEGHSRLPYESSVRRHFGSWNNALLAAGFDLHTDRRPETQEAIMAALRAGESVQAIADRHGVTPGAIHMRVRYRGLRVSEVRKGATS